MDIKRQKEIIDMNLIDYIVDKLGVKKTAQATPDDTDMKEPEEAIEVVQDVAEKRSDEDVSVSPSDAEAVVEKVSDTIAEISDILGVEPEVGAEIVQEVAGEDEVMEEASEKLEAIKKARKLARKIKGEKHSE